MPSLSNALTMAESSHRLRGLQKPDKQLASSVQYDAVPSLALQTPAGRSQRPEAQSVSNLQIHSLSIKPLGPEHTDENLHFPLAQSLLTWHALQEPNLWTQKPSMH